MTILSALVPVLLMVGVGFVAQRRSWISAAAEQGLFRLIINVLVPCLILESVAWNPALKVAQNIFLPPLVGFFSVVLGVALAYGVGGLALKKGNGRRTFALSVGLYNYGYLALPLALFLFDKETVGVLFVFNVGVELALWSVGVWVLSGSGLRESWRRVLNMPLAAIVFAVILNQTGGAVHVPAMLTTTLHWLAPCAIPFGLILSGVAIAGFTKGLNFRQGRLATLLACVLRQGILPPLFLLIPFIMPMPVELKRVILIQAAMTSAVVPILLSKYYNGHPQTAVRIVIASTALGVVTIPFWIRIGLQLHGQ